jgi:hypothetical protein
MYKIASLNYIRYTSVLEIMLKLYYIVYSAVYITSLKIMYKITSLNCIRY